MKNSKLTEKNDPTHSLQAEDLQAREQLLFVAQNSTPAQRLAWLEQLLAILTPYLPRRDKPV